MQCAAAADAKQVAVVVGPTRPQNASGRVIHASKSRRPSQRSVPGQIKPRAALRRRYSETRGSFTDQGPSPWGCCALSLAGEASCCADHVRSLARQTRRSTSRRVCRCRDLQTARGLDRTEPCPLSLACVQWVDPPSARPSLHHLHHRSIACTKAWVAPAATHVPPRRCCLHGTVSVVCPLHLSAAQCTRSHLSMAHCRA